MHRMKSAAWALAIVLSATSIGGVGCGGNKPVVRDQLTVEKLRLRITKVRNAVAETRSVIAASRGAEYLPELYMRLAELLSEEARYHYMVAYEREQKKTKSLHVPQVRFLKEQAIATYRDIVRRYPDTHLADRIMFNISHEQRELGDFEEMRATLEKLVVDYPTSPYRNEALIVLGDYHFDRMEFPQAQKNFKLIIDQESGALRSLALYKQGWVEVNLGDCKAALSDFESAILTARKEKQVAEAGKTIDERKSMLAPGQEFALPEVEGSKQAFAGHKTVNVQRESLVDLTYCYARERSPAKAVAFLRGLAATREAYVSALSKIANRYAMIEQPRGAADVAREILRLATDETDRLDDARLLHTAVTRMKDYSNVGEDVFLILRAMRRQNIMPGKTDEDRKNLENEFEMYARDLSTKSQEMIGAKAPSKKSLWKAQAATPEQTAIAYRTYLQNLPSSPYRILMVQNFADVLTQAGQHLEAGHRYREAARWLAKPGALAPPPEDPKNKMVKAKAATKPAEPAQPQKSKEELEKQRKEDRSNALYDAVVAYQTTLAGENIRTHLERATARAGLREAGALYLAAGQPTAEKAKKIKFAIAQSFYDEGNYLEAIDLLTALAYEYPNTEQGDAAVHMVLDSLHTINDFSGLLSAGQRFLSTTTPVSDKVKSEIVPIVKAAEQRRLDELSLAASGDQAGGMEMLLAFADRYKNSDLGERAMLSAFVAARAGGDAAQLYRLGEELIDKFPQSDQASGVVGTLGRTAAARFEFDEAVQYLERAATMSPQEKTSLLLAAGELREQLADRDGALKDYRAAIAAAGEGPQRGEAAAKLADLIERGGSNNEIIAELSPLSATGDPEVASRLGIAMLRAGSYDEAEAQLRTVVEGASGASPAAAARANYGMAEINLHLLETFPTPDSIDLIEELIGLVDVVIQSYLAAARQPDAIYSQAALARMGRAAEVGATKLASVRVPTDISAEEQDMLTKALSVRAEQLRAGRDEALGECARRAGSSYLLDDTGIACLSKTAPTKDPVSMTPLSPRHRATLPKSLETAKDTLAKNPEDLDALRTVGTAFLDAGDAHAARLVLAQAVEVGGSGEDLNLLGIASRKSGDTIGALDAFRRGKEAGSGAAARNLAQVCRELNQEALAKQALKDVKGAPDGRLLQGVAGGAR